MKKLLTVLLVAVLVFALVSCGSTSDTAAPASEPEEAATEAETMDEAAAPAEEEGLPQLGLKVASINWTNAHGWRITYEAQIKEVADQYIEQGVISEYQALCPNQDSALEVQYFEQCVNDGYDIILINAGGSSGLDAAFEAAIDAGIIVIPVDNLYPYPGVVGVQTDQTVWAGTNFDALVAHFNGAEAKTLKLQRTAGNNRFRSARRCLGSKTG